MVSQSKFSFLPHPVLRGVGLLNPNQVRPLLQSHLSALLSDPKFICLVDSQWNLFCSLWSLAHHLSWSIGISIIYFLWVSSYWIFLPIVVMPLLLGFWLMFSSPKPFSVMINDLPTVNTFSVSGLRIKVSLRLGVKYLMFWRLYFNSRRLFPLS